jgi:hypothetical protein
LLASVIPKPHLPIKLHLIGTVPWFSPREEGASTAAFESWGKDRTWGGPIPCVPEDHTASVKQLWMDRLSVQKLCALLGFPTSCCQFGMQGRCGALFGATRAPNRIVPEPPVGVSVSWHVCAALLVEARITCVAMLPYKRYWIDYCSTVECSLAI